MDYPMANRHRQTNPIHWCEGRLLQIAQEAIDNQWMCDDTLQRMQSEVIRSSTFTNDLSPAQQMMVIAYQRALIDMIEVTQTQQDTNETLIHRRVWKAAPDKLWE